jgi:hypothetical protein
LLEESPTPCSSELFGVNDQPVAARERYSGFISTSLLLLIFCSYKIQIVDEDENQLPSCKPPFQHFMTDAPLHTLILVYGVFYENELDFYGCNPRVLSMMSFIGGTTRGNMVH